MGICNPTSRILTYKLDNEVGATLDLVELDGATYIRLISKDGNILSQLPMSALAGGTVLSEDLTPNISVGGVAAGATIPAGTSFESIVKRILCVPSWYVGFVTNASKSTTVTLSDTELLTYTVGQYGEESGASYAFTPSTAKGVFFLLVRSDSDVSLSAKLVPQGQEGMASSWSYDTMKSSVDWFVGEDSALRIVTFNGYAYTMYGYYNNEWSTSETTSTGIPDVLTVTAA